MTVSAQCSLAIKTQIKYYELLANEQRTKQKTLIMPPDRITVTSYQTRSIRTDT